MRIEPCAHCEQPGWYFDPARQLLTCDAHKPANAMRTLADYRCLPGRVVVIGMNPARVSVATGHYYRGRSGTALWNQLGRVGLLTGATDGRQDEVFVAAGHGLTDLAKVPTDRGDDIPTDELTRAVAPLRVKLRSWQPGLILLRYQAPGYALLAEQFDPPLRTQPHERAIRAGRCADFDDMPTFLLPPPRCRAEIRYQVERELHGLLRELGFLNPPAQRHPQDTG